MARENHCVLSLEAISWLNGELLGDGCLRSQSPISAAYAHSSKYVEYCEYIKRTLHSFGIKQTGKIESHVLREGNTIHCYSSRAYIELKPVRDKWYPKGKKIVPRDIKLTPLTCRQWYIGDGSLIYGERGNPRIALWTNAFPIYDVEWLIIQLQELGLLATRRPSRNAISIATCSTKDFLDYIGKCPVRCYEYKFDYRRSMYG